MTPDHFNPQEYKKLNKTKMMQTLVERGLFQKFTIKSGLKYVLDTENRNRYCGTRQH